MTTVKFYGSYCEHVSAVNRPGSMAILGLEIQSGECLLLSVFVLLALAAKEREP